MHKSQNTNYFSEWFSAVPAKWYAMIPLLVTLVGATAAAAIWANSRGLAWWWVALYIVIVILFVVFSYRAYRKTAIDRDIITAECDILKNKNDNLGSGMAAASQECDTLAKQLRLSASAHPYISDPFIKGRSIYLLDLIAPGARPIIQNRTIEDCEIRGPAMIGFLGTMNLHDISWDGDEKSLFVEVEENHPLLGVIGLEDCTIRRCRFVSVGIIGVKQQIDQMKPAFNAKNANSH